MEIAKQQRQIRDMKLINAHAYLKELKLTKEEKISILKASATELLSKLQKKQATSLQILLTFLEQTLSIGVDLDLLADVNIDQAVLEAKQCDQQRKTLSEQQLKEKGILFGLPMSVKDTVELKGTVSTCGLARLCQNPDLDDGLLAQILKKQGAILFIKSNIPQCLMINESINNIYGRAKNPWDFERTPGGSSGGEGGLIAASCSPLGVGTDIAGSIRIPSLYCGICSIKPTNERITYKGQKSTQFPKMDLDLLNLMPVVGPMAKKIDDLVLFFKAVLGKEMFEGDPFVAPIPFDDQQFQSNKKLVIGYCLEDNQFRTSKAHKRAILQSIKVLESKGHQVKQIEIPFFFEVCLNFSSILCAEGQMKSFMKSLDREQIIDEYSQILMATKIPLCLKGIITWIYRNILKERRISNLIEVGHERNAYQLLGLCSEQMQLKYKVLDIWKKENLDAFISPGLALPAVLHGTSEVLFYNCTYTFYWNNINFPTGCLPITRIRDGEDIYENDGYNDSLTQSAKECMKNSKGLPIGIQISTQPFKEELCLNIMKQIESEIDFNEYPVMRETDKQ